MVGQSLQSQGVTKEVIPPYYSVKEVVLPFAKFPGVDPMRGPEMRSTGEVMGVGENFAEAFAKAQLGAGNTLPRGGRALLSVRNGDKARVVELAKTMKALGFELDATSGTAKALEEAGIEVRRVNKVFEGRPHILDRIKNKEYSYIVNTTEGRQAIEDSKVLRRGALQHKINYTTTLNAAFANCKAHSADDRANVSSVQELHQRLN
jgi:carbamoyl-phosphate synthase large subunit